MNDSSPSLVITEIRVSRKDGGLALQAKGFGKGLNVIRGENSTGRTTLLKLFEEPAEGVHFFVIVSSVEIFLPTLRSRFNILRQGLALAQFGGPTSATNMHLLLTILLYLFYT